MKRSAGLLLYRRGASGAEVLLVHPGGPFWARKDEHAWSIPKGEFASDEDPLAAARREFAEETGFVPRGEAVHLAVRKAAGKAVYVWAVEGDCDTATIRSNNFTMEWPPRSGRIREFPEIDRADWFGLAAARRKIHKGQIPFIDDLERMLAKEPPSVDSP